MPHSPNIKLDKFTRYKIIVPSCHCCSHSLNPHFCEQCESFVNKYLKEIVKLIINDASPEEVCKAINVCTASVKLSSPKVSTPKVCCVVCCLCLCIVDSSLDPRPWFVVWFVVYACA